MLIVSDNCIHARNGHVMCSSHYKLDCGYQLGCLAHSVIYRCLGYELILIEITSKVSTTDFVKMKPVTLVTIM